MGAVGGLHCIGMCGPIVFLLPVKGRGSRRFLGLGLYHLGRILAYTLLGVAFGLIGKGLSLFGWQQKLSVLTGITLILAAFFPLLKSFPFSQKLSRLLGGTQSRFAEFFKSGRPDALLSIGFLNGFLPCGLTYMAVFGSLATGDALQGGLFMSVFGLGTIPLLSSPQVLKSIMNPLLRRVQPRVVSLLLTIVGVVFILRGMGIGIPYVSPKAPTAQQQVNGMECHSPEEQGERSDTETHTDIYQSQNKN